MQEKIRIKTKDGKLISATSFIPDISNGKNITVAPAAQFTQRNYASFALCFQQWGYHVITFDYRGIGDSAPQRLKGYNARLQQWAVQDADAVIRYVKTSFPNQELIYIGHGIGGELVGLAQASQYIHKLVLASCSLSCKRLWSWKGRMRITVMKTIGRIVTKWLGYFPGKRLGIMRDLPKGVMHEWADWCDNPNGLFDVFPENNYRKLQVPLFAFSFSNDWMTPDKAVKGLLSYFSGASITWYHVHPHNQGFKKKEQHCFFDLRLKDTLWIKLQRWLNEEPPDEIPLTVKPLNLDSNET
jgi:predicted alpha/beta hydrolase